MWRVDTVTDGLEGAPFYTRLYFNDSVGSPSDAAAAVVGFWETLAPVIDNALTMAVQGNVFVVDNITQEITGIEVAGSADVIPGENGASEASLATQGLIRWRTGSYVGGREVRGRTFIPGVTSTSVATGGPSSTYISTLGGAATGLIGHAASQLVVGSKVHGVVREVAFAEVWNEFAVLRSRRD